MPLAVTHVLIAIILVDLYRDYLVKDKRKIPLGFVLIGGVAGLLPDIDIPIYWLLHNFLGFNIPWFHRGFTHTVFFPMIFLGIALMFHQLKKHKLSIVFGVISFGVTIHILLDMLLSGGVTPFFPFWDFTYEWGIFANIALPSFWQGLDAMILLAWLWHEEVKHKIKDFI